MVATLTFLGKEVAHEAGEAFGLDFGPYEQLRRKDDIRTRRDSLDGTTLFRLRSSLCFIHIKNVQNCFAWRNVSSYNVHNYYVHRKGVGVMIQRYLRIQTHIWSNPDFQALWAQRWEKPCHKPRRLPYWRYELPEREHLILTRFHAYQNISRKIRLALVATYGEQCVACRATTNLVNDHIIPLCWGGTNDPCNFQLLCGTCNTRKGSMLPVPPRREGHSL